ncbi:hypothetical protein LOTGIDRAFT_125492, partial [Lottia gigantea]
YAQVKYGEPVELTCTATGSPTPTIEWFRGNDQPVQSSVSVVNGVFRIESATKSDESEYYCKATNSAGMAQVRTIVYVTGPPKITIKPGRRVSVIVGETVTLECTGEGAPTPNVFWRSETPRRSDILPEAYEPQDGSALLIFDDVQKQDAGRYICIATNERGKTEDTVDLTGKIYIFFCYL